MTTDTTERRRASLLDSQRRVLERIADGAPLEDVLLVLVKLIEEQASGMRCTVLLADAGETRLRFVAAPSFSADFRDSMEPYLAIAPDAAPCGVAAYHKRPVYIRDIAADPQWSAFRDIMQRNDVPAVWSTPIPGDNNWVLGTFAMYYAKPRLPSNEHSELINMAVQMARVAIEAKADDDILRNTFDNAPRAIVITDIEGSIVRANHAFARALGYAPADLRGRAIAEIIEGHDTASLLKELLANEKEVSSDRRYRTRDGKVLWARERSSVRRDARGKPRYVVTHVEHLSAAADPLARLSSRERQVLELVVAGRTSKGIAAQLGISPASVDTYRSRIMLKLGIEDLPALVRFAIRHGIASV
jgi:PAS domain S-box-containing protein